MLLAYYYHENSDSIFIDYHNKDFGPILHDSTHKVGLCFRGNIHELKKRYLRRKKHKGIMFFKLNEVTINFEKPYLPF